MGIIASPAFNPAEDGDLVALEGVEIFPGAVTEIILRPGTFSADICMTLSKNLRPI